MVHTEAVRTVSPAPSTEKPPRRPSPKRKPAHRKREPAPPWTIDELARQTGITTRNIRAYHSKGLLPPPRLVGRTGFYEARHIQRLQAISRLLERGFSITSIRALLSDWEQGSTLADALGFQDLLEAGETSKVTRKELQRLFPEMGDHPELLQRGIEAGLFSVNDDQILLLEPLLVEVGLKLTRAGVTLSDAMRLFEQLVADVRPAAQRYFRMLLDHGWEPPLASKTGTQAKVRDSLSTLVPLARVAVSSTFARELRILLTEASRKRASAANQH